MMELFCPYRYISMHSGVWLPEEEVYDTHNLRLEPTSLGLVVAFEDTSQLCPNQKYTVVPGFYVGQLPLIEGRIRRMEIKPVPDEQQGQISRELQERRIYPRLVIVW